jgi:subtilase family serine protease
MRRPPLRPLTVAVALLTLLAACSASSPTPGSQGSHPVATPSGRVGLVGATDDQRGTRVGPTDPARKISLSISMASASEDEISRALAAIEDPKSPEYHHYLTPQEYAKRFGPPAAALATVEGSLRGAGFTVTLPSAGGSLLGAQGTVGQAEAFFAVQLSDYRTASGAVYYAPDAAPRLPDDWKGAALNVLGLNNRPALHPAGVLRMTPPAQQPPPRLLDPTALQRAYSIAPLRLAGLNGDGQTIALPEIDTFKQFDIDYYDRTYGISAPPIEVVKVGGGADKAQQVSETTLDLEIIHAIAPRAKIIVYEGPADYSSLADTFNRIVTDNRAKVMSVSLGGCEPAIWESADLGRNYFTTLNNIFSQAAAQGMSVFVASGDDGAYTCHRNDPNDNTVSASLPATNPFVTAVGGTALLVNDNGSYYGEAGWEGPLAGSGTGGGLSVGYRRPDWQTGPGVTGNQYSNGMRQVPDIAASADPLTGYRIYDSTGGGCSGEDCWVAIGGTSASTPLWASLITLANQRATSAGKSTLGFINPALYKMGSSATLKAAFHDVTVGGNLYYPATSAWDFTTGWGSPVTDTLVAELLTLQSSGG